MIYCDIDLPDIDLPDIDLPDIDLPIDRSEKHRSEKPCKMKREVIMAFIIFVLGLGFAGCDNVDRLLGTEKTPTKEESVCPEGRVIISIPENNLDDYCLDSRK